MLKIYFSLFLAFVYSTGFSQLTSNLPIVIINTLGSPINDEPGVVVDFKIINNSSGLNSQFDVPNEYNGKAKAEYRGCSSQSFEKKSYGIELRSSDNTEEDINRSLFGFPEESDWVLNASFTDKTFLREVLGFELSTRSGQYASRTKFVELILDGSYHGVYVFQEKVKRDSGRVPIQSLSNSDTELPRISGGYLLKIDKGCGNSDPNWDSKYDSPNGNPGRKYNWKVDYPNSRNINNQQFQYIRSYIDGFEDFMNGASVCDAVSGYQSVINEDSFVDYFLMQEVMSNADAFRFSSFFYKRRNDNLLYAGPGWDFNLAGGFFTTPVDGNTFTYQGWRYTDMGDPSFPVPFFWWKLLDCSIFKQKLVDRYKELRRTTWSTQELLGMLESKYQELNSNQAYSRNFSRWPILGTQVWVGSYVGGSVEQEKIHLTGWLSSRLQWLDNNIESVSSAPLPVNFTSFTAAQAEDKVLVEWTTVSESGSSHFEVERAVDVSSFTSIGRVTAMGDFKGLKNYKFVDENPFPGVNYYRLKQVDLDGTYSFTAIQSVNYLSERSELFVSPNPVRNLLKINSGPGSAWRRYDIFDSAGRIIQSDALKAIDQQQIPVSRLSTGIYLLQLSSEKGRPQRVRFVVE